MARTIQQRAQRSDSEVELVVARYREAVGWVRNTPGDVAVTIYDKGGDLEPQSVPGMRVEQLPNIGLEAHTYLQHVVSHYHALAPCTLFCQGHPFDHAHDLHLFLRSLASGEATVTGFRWLGFIIDSDDPRGRRLFVPWSKNRDGRELPLDRFYRELFGETAPPWTHFYVGAQFAVTREQIHRRPLRFYRRALELAIEFPDAAQCYERVWDQVFSSCGVDRSLLGDELCRYLKPIRRLASGA